MPLPFSLARPLPRSPLRSADGHRNRDAIVPRYLHISAFPIGNRYSVADSVRSLQIPSAPPRNGSRFICRLPFFFAWLRCGECTPVACLRQADRLHAVVFRARFAARHDSRLGQLFCGLSRLMSLAYQKGKFVPFGAKSSQNSLPDTSWFRLNSITLKGTCLCG